MVFASDTPDKEDFKGILAPHVVQVEYDVGVATSASLVRLIENSKRKNGGPFASVALACHGDGPASGFAWKISENLVVTDASSIDADVIDVMSALSAATVPRGRGGRVDLFACALLATASGKAVFDEIQSATDAHFAASDDLTGNAGSKGVQDWVMESDGVNVKPPTSSTTQCI